MQEKQALSGAPERSRTELVRTSRSLIDAVRQTRTHVMKREVGIRMVGNV